MKIVRFNDHNQPKFGLIKDNHIEILRDEPFSGIKKTGISVMKDRVKLLAPVMPSKIIAVGLNYKDHATELGMKLPDNPCLFLKPPSSVIGPNEDILYPAMAGRVDFEAELAVVIGRRARSVSAKKAEHYIFGYTCANDVTARDLQQMDAQWTRAKSFDTFCPLGPHIETELDPDDLEIISRLNGEVKQNSRTSQMIFSVTELVSFISEVMTILPGDIILTGTPIGVGSMQVSDAVEVEISGIGILGNRLE
ncbi:MAG TPA: DUF2437 domain-containing protein [Actinobacteria bacterium]|nr:DUF2437 domain-containing protein [Actinomycetes bacterium]HEX21055.1 DUF2437 domain-containing protein [Actinomycetota bacterium]